VLLLFVPAFLLGTWARGLGLEANVGAGESILPVILAEYTPAWFAALVVAGAIAAMMSSSDSMLLSGSSYFTRDIYRPLVDDGITERQEDRLGRIGVAVFAIGALIASVWAEAEAFGAGTVGSILVAIGDLAFGGFAQLALPVMLALYWRRTTGSGITAGIVLSQVVYIGFNFLPEVPIGSIVLFSGAYLGWGISMYCMLLGLVTTVAVSALTSPKPEANVDGHFGLKAD
jgi:SSS family solute:Na+ symporter